MKLTSDSFSFGETIPAIHAFGVPDPERHMAFGPNRNPHLRWTDPPEGTRSFAIIMHDPDVPTSGEDVNQEGRRVPADLPRTNFFHWVLVDVPTDVREIPQGAVSDGVTPRGKPAGPGPFGRSGVNDYTGWFAGDADLEGDWCGYDGPCPPWNDERLHHYHFTVYVLDVDRLDLGDSFTGPDAISAMAGHVLESAELVGSYSLNPDLRGG